MHTPTKPIFCCCFFLVSSNTRYDYGGLGLKSDRWRIITKEEASKNVSSRRVMARVKAVPGRSAWWHVVLAASKGARWFVDRPDIRVAYQRKNLNSGIFPNTLCSSKSLQICDSWILDDGFATPHDCRIHLFWKIHIEGYGNPDPSPKARLTLRSATVSTGPR